MTARQPHETASGYLTALASHLHVDPTPSAARAHVARAAAEARGVRARWRRRVARLSLLVATFATFIGTSGVAAAGHLPPKVQEMVADAARLMPVPVPIPYPEPSSSDTGTEPDLVEAAKSAAPEIEQTPSSETAEPTREVKPEREHHGDTDNTRGPAERDHKDRWGDRQERADKDDRGNRQERESEGGKARGDTEDRDRSDRDEASGRDEDRGRDRGESGEWGKEDPDDRDDKNEKGSESDSRDARDEGQDPDEEGDRGGRDQDQNDSVDQERQGKEGQ